MPWRALRLAAPFWPMGREVLEMRYLWETPHRIDGARLRAALPELRETPLEAALRAAVAPRLSSLVGEGVPGAGCGPEETAAP
jgi:hypothetical protein